MSELESLDTRGLLCPLPVIRTQERVRRLQAGATLEVEATDAGTLEDIPAWCRVHGHRLLSSESVEKEPGEDSSTVFRIQVCGD